jgi:hypothetical protein
VFSVYTEFLSAHSTHWLRAWFVLVPWGLQHPVRRLLSPVEWGASTCAHRSRGAMGDEWRWTDPHASCTFAARTLRRRPGDGVPG